MLAADKQVLDAYLRDELQQLRRIELENVIVRFNSALTPSTLIAGFCFTAIVEMEILDPDETAKIHAEQRSGERIFYISTSIALALSLFVTAVSSAGIVFGQRLAVQATAEQGFQHDRLIAELNSKFIQSCFALGLSMFCVVLSSISIVWAKQAASDGEQHVASYAASIVTVVIFLWTVFTMWQMFSRLHTWSPANSKLALTASQRAAAAKKNGVNADEFYVQENVSHEYLKKRQEQSTRAMAAPTESSGLLASAMPCGAREGKSSI